MVHRREVDGQPVIFGNQGDLWNNAMTWFDHDTGSVWSQVTGAAMMGPLKGTQLELLPSTLTTWSDWQSRFPETRALTGHNRSVGFRLEQMAVVAAVGDDSAAIMITDLRDVGWVEAIVGGRPVLYVHDSALGRWAVWSRAVDGEMLDLRVEDGQVVDSRGRAWDAERGLPVAGEAPPLERIPTFTSFPDDYERIFPEGRFLTE
jgi:hypothetical protein